MRHKGKMGCVGELKKKNLISEPRMALAQLRQKKGDVGDIEAQRGVTCGEHGESLAWSRFWSCRVTSEQTVRPIAVRVVPPYEPLGGGAGCGGGVGGGVR